MPPYFALPWVITWFSHSIADLNIVARLFDVFMGNHPLLPLYVSTSVWIFAKFYSACVILHTYVYNHSPESTTSCLSTLGNQSSH